MAKRSIVRLGHPALRTVAKQVSRAELASEETQQLIDDMIETMIAEGGVGLAAPQLGIELQLLVYSVFDADLDQSDEFEERPSETRVLVNPALEPAVGDVLYDWEGCLSIPDLRGLVPRYPGIRVHALDRHGEILEFDASSFEARIIQHEFDHLNGLLFLDRMRDFRSLAFYDEWEEFWTTDEPPGSEQSEPPLAEGAKSSD